MKRQQAEQLHPPFTPLYALQWRFGPQIARRTNHGG